MPRKYQNFTEIERDGDTSVVAQPTNASDEEVRLDAGWFDGAPGGGDWEDAVAAVVREELTDGLDLSDGTGTLPRRRAVERFADATRDGRPAVDGEAEAEALLDYFAENGVVELDGDEVVLLPDPGEASGRAMLNWAVAMDVCVDMLDATLERLARAESDLRAEADGPDAGDSEASRSVEEVARTRADLEDARDALDRKREEVRATALRQQLFPENAVDVAEQLADLATALSGIDGVDADGPDTDADSS